MTRRRHPTPAEAKVAVLGFANVVAGVLDFLGDVSEGEETLPAAKRAARGVRSRAKALARAEADDRVEVRVVRPRARKR